MNINLKTLKKVIYTSFSEIYISGKNGLFVKLISEYNNWSYHKKYINKTLNDELSIKLECIITDFIKVGDIYYIISENNDFIKFDSVSDKFFYYDFGYEFKRIKYIVPH